MNTLRRPGAASARAGVWLASHLLAPWAVCLVLALDVIHPLIHGTPLDGGSLDAIIAQLNLVAAYLTVTEE